MLNIEGYLLNCYKISSLQDKLYKQIHFDNFLLDKQNNKSINIKSMVVDKMYILLNLCKLCKDGYINYIYYQMHKLYQNRPLNNYYYKKNKDFYKNCNFDLLVQSINYKQNRMFDRYYCLIYMFLQHNFISKYYYINNLVDMNYNYWQRQCILNNSLSKVSKLNQTKKFDLDNYRCIDFDINLILNMKDIFQM